MNENNKCTRVPYGSWNKDTMQDYLNKHTPGYVILDAKEGYKIERA